jgi:hypothetical protein
MANLARITLENALRAKHLDRTLTPVAIAVAQEDSSRAATGISQLDRVLHGGFPHGQLSEIAGPESSGRLTVALQALAGATVRGELAAYVDTCDRLDVASAAAAGVALDRLLWIRGRHSSRSPGRAASDLEERMLDRALKAFMLVLQAGGFGLVVLDLAGVPPAALRRLPPATWLRVQRAVEGHETACVLLAPEPLARSAGGLTLVLRAQATWGGDAGHSRVMTGLALGGRVISPRRRMEGELALSAHHAWVVPTRQAVS